MRITHFLFIIFSVGFFTGCSESKKEAYSPQLGDLIFQDLDCGPLCEAIESVTTAYDTFRVSHMGMVCAIENDTVWVIEAIGNAVQRTSYSKFVSRTPINFVGRVKPEYTSVTTSAVAYANETLGTPYDNVYLMDDSTLYCSEMIYKAFYKANENQPFFELAPMTFKTPGTDNFFEAWVDYYAQLNIAIPEGELGCNPAGISRSAYLDIVAIL